MRTIACLLSLLLLSANAHSQGPAPTPADPSFNCARAKSPAELAICADPKLATLDRQLLGLYQRAKAAATDKKAFEVERERAWRERENTCRDAPCVERWLRERTAHYEAALGQKSATLAPTPTEASTSPKRPSAADPSTTKSPPAQQTEPPIFYASREAREDALALGFPCRAAIREWAVVKGPLADLQIPLADIFASFLDEFRLYVADPQMVVSVRGDNLYVVVAALDSEGKRKFNAPWIISRAGGRFLTGQDVHPYIVSNCQQRFREANLPSAK